MNKETTVDFLPKRYGKLSSSTHWVEARFRVRAEHYTVIYNSVLSKLPDNEMDGYFRLEKVTTVMDKFGVEYDYAIFYMHVRKVYYLKTLRLTAKKNASKIIAKIHSFNAEITALGGGY